LFRLTLDLIRRPTRGTEVGEEDTEVMEDGVDMVVVGVVGVAGATVVEQLGDGIENSPKKFHIL
jgi:hypothetical protein